ncbi:MAG TPA: SIS domain-containing protein [Gemmatimonadales bacterium]|jgi:D-sedoheptulose 7-phosphate isomerase|nr:SIS domain-containing protein [Gemmatimonadales bacterium]
MASLPDMSDHIARQLRALSDLALGMAAQSATIQRIAERYVETLKQGGTLFFAGNGGSAADAQHLATEYVVRYDAERRPFAAIALTTDTSLLTAAGNDLGFAEVFARQIRAVGRPGDLLVLHSTSGKSVNLVRAAEAARQRQVGTIAFLGKGGGALRGGVDDSLVVPSEITSHIQEVHLAVQHIIVELVEQMMQPV